MNLRLLLMAFFLLGMGIFSNAQDKKQGQAAAKPTVENGPDAIPVSVTSSKKAKKIPPKMEITKFTPPKIVKDAAPPPPPPPPAKKLKTLPAPPTPPKQKQDA